MRILLLNQTFYPDVASTAQYLRDLAMRLASRGHQVTVVTSQRAYDDGARRFPRRENWRNIEIHRVPSTGFGKRAKWRRALDFASFLVSASLRALTLRRHEVIVALTSPPLIAFVAAWLARLWGSRFFYWVMDLNPDEALRAGWLKPSSLMSRALDCMSRFSLRQAEKNIVLDRFMHTLVANKGVSVDRIRVIPPWSHDEVVTFDAGGREEFRRAHGLNGKFVIMYSGNHSPCHPLDTLLRAAQRLADRPEFAFCFVGGGSEFAGVRRFAQQHPLAQIVCLPYQPLSRLAGSLSAADLHVVVMGGPFVGTIHPCKVYNILRVGAPMLYLGPSPSHVSDILDELGENPFWRRVAPGDVDRVLQCITEIARTGQRGDVAALDRIARRFSIDTLLPRLVAELEAAPEPGRTWNRTPRASVPLPGRGKPNAICSD